MKKFNWGHGILAAIIIMVLAILTLVFRVTKERIDLVSEDYYPKGLVYDIEIEKQQNTKALSDQPEIDITDVITVKMPSDFKNPEEIVGEIWFYKASDKTYDFRDSISLDTGLIIDYPLSKLANGKYDLIIDWKYRDKGYFYKESIFVEKD